MLNMSVSHVIESTAGGKHCGCQEVSVHIKKSAPILTFTRCFDLQFLLMKKGLLFWHIFRAVIYNSVR